MTTIRNICSNFVPIFKNTIWKNEISIFLPLPWKIHIHPAFLILVQYQFILFVHAFFSFYSQQDVTNLSLGILELTVEREGWYTLTGVNLEGKPSEKGMYIYNGRKMILP